MREFTYTVPLSAGTEEDTRLYFDIETTGFSRSRTMLYLIGCGRQENDTFVIRQWFNDDGESEKSILEAFSDTVSSSSRILCTFNGESFDIPYLKDHYERHSLTDPFSGCRSFDYYKILRPWQKLFGMDQGSQKAWELFLGIKREDRFDGGQLIGVYQDYLTSRDDAALYELLLHNREDIEGMLSLKSLEAYREITRGTFTADDIRMTDSGNLKVTCRLKDPVPVPFEVLSETAIRARGNCLTIEIPCLQTELKYFYDNYKDYYYLPDEDRAIHRSVGRYVDRKHRKAARASNCYMRKDGIFLPLPSCHGKYGFSVSKTEHYASSLAFFRHSHNDRTAYVEAESLAESGKSVFIRFLCDTMKAAFIEEISKNQ